MTMAFINNSFISLNVSNSSNSTLATKNEENRPIDMLFLLQYMAAIFPNSIVLILIVYFSDLRKSVKCQYFINHTILNIILVLMIWAYRRTPTLSWLYCRDTTVIIACITYIVDMRSYYQEIKEPNQFTATTVKDVITIVMILIWPPPFLLICIALISQVVLYTWTLVFMCIISIGFTVLCAVSIQIFLIARNVENDDNDDVFLDDVDISTEFTHRHHIISVLFLSFVSLKMMYSYLMLARVFPYDFNIDTTLYQIIIFTCIVEPLLFIFMSRDMKEVFKRITRYLNNEQRALDRKKTKKLLMRERFSSSI